MKNEIIYINGKKFYDKLSVIRLKDEVINNNRVIIYKDKNSNIVYGFILKNYPNILPQNFNKINDLFDYFGVNIYGTITNKNTLIVTSSNKKDNVLRNITFKLKLNKYKNKKLNIDNLINIVNLIISKYGYNVGYYSMLIDKNKKIKLKNNKIKYSGFLPNVSGEDSINLYYILTDEFNFKVKKYEAEYYYILEKDNLLVEYIEGDVYLIK